MSDLDSFFNSFLNVSDDAAVVHIPAGDGFQSSGFICQVSAAVLYSFWTANAVHLMPEAAELVNSGRLSYRGRDGSWRYYSRDEATAKEANDLAGNQYPPSQVWRLEAPVESVLNFQSTDAAKKWENGISGDIRMTTLRSKHRVEFHLLALPAYVQAIAKVTGLISETPVNFDELNVQDLVVTEALEAQLVGPDGKFREGALWERRAALWKLLGEESADVYLPEVSADKKYSTKSKALDRCLQGVVREWKAGLWCRLQFISSPVSGAVYGEENKRLSYPVIIQIFKNKEDAQAAATAELEEAGVAPGATAQAANLKLPEAWNGYEAAFRETCAGIKAEHPVKPVQPVLVKLAADNGVTPDELVSWVWGA